MYPASVRGIALVAAFVLAVVGIGAAIAGGTGVLPVPRGWVAVNDLGARVSVPRTWKVLYNDSCKFEFSPGVLYVDTRVVPYALCAFPTAAVSNAPVVSIGPVTGQPAAGSRLSTVNGIEVWSNSSDGFVVEDVPSLGVTLTANGPSAYRVLDTLTYAPD
jgi:hypothetical protein